MVTFPRHRRLRHGSDDGRGAAAERGETPFALGTPAAIVPRHFIGEPLRSVTLPVVIRRRERPGHIIKNFAHGHQPPRHLRPVPIDDAVQRRGALPAPEDTRRKARGHCGGASRPERCGDQVLPAPPVPCERLPHDDVCDDGARRGRPFGEGTERGRRSRRDRAIGKEERVTERQRPARPREHRECGRSPRPGTAGKQHGKEGHEHENEREPLHPHSRRRIAEHHHGDAARDELIRRQSGLYPSEKDGITYRLCNKRECARQHGAKHASGHALPRERGEHGVRELGDERRRGARDGSDALAQTSAYGVHHGKDDDGDGDEKKGPRRG